MKICVLQIGSQVGKVAGTMKTALLDQWKNHVDKYFPLAESSMIFFSFCTE